MPQHAWNQILQKDSLIHLFKSEKGIISERHAEAWVDLQQQYYDEFGIDQEMRMRINSMITLAKLNYEYIMTGNRMLLNLIEIEELELKGWGQIEETKFSEVLIHVQKYMGFRIDPKKISVIEWGHMVRNMVKDVQRQNKVSGTN